MKKKVLTEAVTQLFMYPLPQMKIQQEQPLMTSLWKKNTTSIMFTLIKMETKQQKNQKKWLITAMLL